MKKIITICLSLILLLFVSSCLADIPSPSDDVEYANGFIQRIPDADNVIVQGNMLNREEGRTERVRFTLKTTEDKEILHAFMSELKLQFDKEETISRRNGSRCGCAVWGKITSSHGDKHESLHFLCSGLFSEDKAVFSINNEEFDHNEFFLVLKNANIPYEHVKKDLPQRDRKDPPKERPEIILGTWYSEDGQLEVEFQKDGTFKIHKSPMDFKVHRSKVPDEYKTFHYVGKESEWEIYLSSSRLSLRMAFTAKSSKGINIIRLDEKHLDLQFSNYPVTHLIRKK